MTAKILRLVLVCLTLSVGASAAGEDVALITALTGTASASWVEPAADDNSAADANRRSHEWSLEVAEMLPVGAEVTTAAESSLTIIHLAGNIEYNIGALAQAKITGDRVEGQDIASSQVRLVSSDLVLEGSMQNQVGAVISDHVDVGGTKDTFDSLSRETQLARLTLAIKTVPESPPLPSKSTTNGYPSPISRYVDDQGNQTMQEASQSDNECDDMARLKEEKKKSPVKIIDACFALPREILAKVYPADESLEVDNYDIKVVEAFGGWVDFNFKTPLIDRNFNLNISGSGGTLPITLHIEHAAPSVAYAWRLEKSGLLAQAASIWLKLQTQGMAEKKVAPHLKRIREQLVKSQN
ncbi:MAG: hypothetical protein CVV42_18945 [Candidatus Riflebacteria bacterium HGW-Riflebacteria-2]|jgi:hypothetical protein|nr:MAG: hypothetical protein CVV42_18945 [Candidatus Riflebacteria bacterium HGW-Riflebacteria-2]